MNGVATDEVLGPPQLAEVRHALAVDLTFEGEVTLGGCREISLAAEKEERPLAPAKEGNGKSPKPAKRIPERSAAPTRTGRGTSMGGAASAKERASAGLMPVAGLDVTLEEADTLSNSGVTATVDDSAILAGTGLNGGVTHNGTVSVEGNSASARASGNEVSQSISLAANSVGLCGGNAVLTGGTAAWIDAGLPLEHGETRLASPRVDRYRRPYEGTDNAAAAMQAYLDWEYGLVDQLKRDGTHHFGVI